MPTVNQFIESQPADRQGLLHLLHDTILANDANVTAVIEPMMGKEMIIYKEGGHMKYALASVKQHMSLHCLPIYIDADLYNKYKGLFPDAKVQKGCINFTNPKAMPIETVNALIKDTSVISIPAFMEARKKPKVK